ncbi:MAG: acetyl-CoA carboxylase biotin carboxylase subunit family protein [Planctomycetota bacterium]
MKTILVIGPTAWDREELAAPRLAASYRFQFIDDGACSVPARIGLRHLFRRFDPLPYIDRLAALDGTIDGVLGTDDYLAASVAAAVAQKRGLPGPAPKAVLLCQHKFHAREVLAEVAPEATPQFVVIDSRAHAPAIGLPLFVKPVRGTFSILAKRIDSLAELRTHVRIGFATRRVALNLLWPYDRLLSYYRPTSLPAGCFIGERILDGALVTVEGFAARGRVEFLGITDSIMYEGTISFRRFDYPSRLPESVQARMRELATRAVLRLGLDDTVFNVEMFFNAASDSIHIVEVNPRMAYQFADLYEKVDGNNTYDVQLALVTGDTPVVRRAQGPHRVATSFVFRRFDDAVLTRQPTAADLSCLRAQIPDVRVRLYGETGRRLSQIEQGVESYRYAIVNLGGSSWDDLDAQFEMAKKFLPFEFAR